MTYHPETAAQRGLPGPRAPNDWLYLHYEPLWRALRRELGALRGRVLDVGCGLQPYRSLLGPEVEYVGLDRPGREPKADLEGDAQAIPAPDGSFDAVMSTQVLEHVTDPAAALREAVRVLRPGGRVVLTVPGCWPAHEVPHDFWRFTRHGVLHLVEAAGLGELRLEVLGGLWATVGQMFALELAHRGRWRRLVPAVNRLAHYLEQHAPAREELVMTWLLTARKP